jgi:hypothetical protein
VGSVGLDAKTRLVKPNKLGIAVRLHEPYFFIDDEPFLNKLSMIKNIVIGMRIYE